MCFFAQIDQSSLYAAAGGPGDGWLGYLLPTGITAEPCIELQPALTDPALGGSFVFAAPAPDLSTPQKLQAFITAVQGVLASARGMVWLTDPGAITQATAPYLGIDASGSRVLLGLVAPIVQAPGSTVIVLSLEVSSGLTLSLDGETITVQGTGGITFGGTRAPRAMQISSATLPMSGPYRGCFRFGTFLQRQSLQTRLSWGFQFLFPGTAGAVQSAVTEYLPLADGTLPNPSDWVGFAASVDPNDPLNTVLQADRTALVFTGQNFDDSQTVLASYYRTSFGAPVTLVPVPGPLDGNPDAGRLVFHAGCTTEDGGELFQASPVGDFVLALDGARPDTAYDLMCGVQGTEFTSFQPAIDGGYLGDRLRFSARQAAYAPRWPFQAASPVGPPVDAQAPLLETKYLTSWGTLVRAGGAPGAIPYVAQPRGASLYGRDALIHQGTTAPVGGGGGFPTLFGAMDPSVILPGGAFPLGPYAGFAPGDGSTSGMTSEQSERFEREVVGPTRRLRIGGGNGQHAPSRVAALKLVGAPEDDGRYNTTTPTGLLVTVDGGAWTKVLLGQNWPPPAPPSVQAAAAAGQAPAEEDTGDSPFRQMYFCRPNATLQQALQTGQLFMVAANAVNLGTLSGAGFGACGAGAAFYNRMNVGAWDMAAQVGQNNRYDDYTNVLIVKGRRGALWDPSSDATKAASLVSNPDQWTQKDALASPSDLRVDPATGKEVVGDPDPTELTILSGWLQRYFQAAFDETDTEYFSTFTRIAKDPDWTGILMLRLNIAQLPDDLAGIMAGVTAPELFFAHHLAIQISPVANDPAAPDIQLSDPSSIFGLIYYVDPSFTPPAPGQTAQPVPPAAGTDYDFRLLTLKVLFQNSAVQRFQSWAQLTLNTFFGMKVTRMGGAGANPYNTLVLAGSYQNNNGKPLYSLATQADSTFFFDNNVVRKIEVRSAAMSTLNPGNQPVDPTVISWFGLTGLVDFRVTWQVDDPGDGTPKKYSPFDVFSFGSDEPPPTDPPTPPGDGQPGKGLAFTNLGVRMSFPESDTSQRAFAFVSDQIRFDVTRSTPRPGCLFQNFALQVEGLARGTKDSGPSAAGFLTVIPDAVFTGVDGSEWTGIRYGLNLGSPGALAGNVGLTSRLLTAWAPDSRGDGTYRAVVGLQLPGTGGGAKLISLQTVLKLSIGQLRLSRDRDASSFLLMMTEIALRFLGLLKIPPSGSTLFYLFGNPRSDGKPSGLGWYAMYKR